MQIFTTARHCELDPELRSYAQQRLEKLERFARDIHEAHLILTLEKYRHIAEITLRLNQHEMVSREESTDSRAAFERAADHLEKQLRKLKEKRAARHRAGPTADERLRFDGTAPSLGDGASEPAAED
jgi:putative sigma-54 modulation protein